MEIFTADIKWKSCLRADSNIRLGKPGFGGELFTKMAANNFSHHCTPIPLFLASGEVYDSLCLNWGQLSDLL